MRDFFDVVGMIDGPTLNTQQLLSCFSAPNKLKGFSMLTTRKALFALLRSIIHCQPSHLGESLHFSWENTGPIPKCLTCQECESSHNAPLKIMYIQLESLSVMTKVTFLHFLCFCIRVSDKKLSRLVTYKCLDQSWRPLDRERHDVTDVIFWCTNFLLPRFIKIKTQFRH